MYATKKFSFDTWKAEEEHLSLIHYKLTTLEISRLSISFEIEVEATSPAIKMFKFIVVIFSFINACLSQNVPGVCFCVPTGTCNNNTGGTGGNGGLDGTGQIVR